LFPWHPFLNFSA
jgi:hypothetical protein